MASMKAMSKMDPFEKLEYINQKMAEVKRKRISLDTNKSSLKPKKGKKGKPRDLSPPSTPMTRPGSPSSASLSFPKPKLKLLHPKLDLVFGEIMYSPYMTKPQDLYSREMYSMNAKLVAIKSSGQRIKDMPLEERPYNVKKLKDAFVEEVINFNPSYVMTSVSPACHVVM